MSGCRETKAVEALHDGQLEPERAKALVAHVATCHDCAAEARRLADLTAALRALPGAEANATRVLAGRKRLLAAAGSEGKRRWSLRGGVVAATAALALTVVVFRVGRVHRGAEPVASVAGGMSELELSVTPIGAAHWSRVSMLTTETLTLGDGALNVAVKRHDPRQRLVVELPDGELEDVGTVFSVSVAAGKTREVSVSEGSVALRLRGSPERRIVAGETFRAEDTALATSNATVTPGTASSATGVEVSDAHARPVGSAARSSARPGDEAEACPEASLFQDGVQAFKHGDYASAASTLARFSASCVHSDHAEDAAYVRMVALARAGANDEARAQALAYLKRFPTGFRRKEAARLAGVEGQQLR